MNNLKKILILTGILCLTLNVWARQTTADRISVNYNEQPLLSILADLRKNHKLNFSYSNTDIPLEKKISLRLSKKTIAEVLNAITEKAGLQWQQIGKQIVLKSRPSKVKAEIDQPPLQLTQTVRGKVIDKESNSPLPGVILRLTSVSPVKLVSTDEAGEFRFLNVPVGRQEIEATTIGYRPVALNQVLVSSGKELVLTIAMSESVTDLNAVVITAKKGGSRSINDMTTVSARSFTVEETSRYAASFFDPARMALSLAGVTAGNDVNNDIVVRGNSSKGLQWRLEGVEIINPNHFGEEGSSAGGISMISSSMLSTSDFLTGAFPAEYGNALSGVFDLQFRKGNTEKREYSFMAGVLGTEASLEGPFKAGGKSSYLVNYRYSTLSFLDKIGISPWPEGFTPVYQDIAFNFNFPTANAGTFSIFGIGGNSGQKMDAERDYTSWEVLDDKSDRKSVYNSGSAGLKHILQLSNKVYLKNIVSLSGSKITDDRDTLTNGYEVNVFGRDAYQNTAMRYSGLLNYKASARNTFRAGMIVSRLGFDLSSLTHKIDIGRLSMVLDAKGSAWNPEVYGQWKHQFTDKFALHTGLHASYFDLSDTYSVEPRLGLTWWISPSEQVSLGTGVHSRLEPMAYYFARNELKDGTVITSNSKLEPTKAMHAVAGYERSFRGGLRFKAEAYYQQLFNVPVSNDPNANFSSLNTANAYFVYSRGYRQLVNKGKGSNTGLELTLEKSLSRGYYFLATSSLFDSRFKNINGKVFNTDYNTNYAGSFVSGKEWKTGAAGKNLVGLNTKIVYTGGRPYSPINLEESVKNDYHTIYEDRVNTLKTSAYFRVDLSASYRINRPRVAHAFFLDIQNAMNRLNQLGEFYNSEKNKIEPITLSGIIPSLYYRIEF
ncbi:carboxypeptidase regulatory-like domain-containing protein [Paradesertivirga mongoliensis]|uniref:Carboxypeptidase regulatory-like domain-containing protein n=1 Tax=Paradesertivirga mongoliensis TaxID=2100740 RepID=A0ABW4ZL24_9SPHI|nr:carboxypeptidase regulatory-like domain-containing protein [Pedobacter mongoliensis]